MTEPSLDGAFAKLDRADAHLRGLKKSLEGFLEEHPYGVVSQEDPDTGECVLYGKVRKRPPVLDWGVCIGDVVQNLRSALDHLAWQLALQHRPDEEPPANTAFPIFKDKDRFLVEVANSKRSPIAGIDPAVHERIRELQPCYRGNRPWADPLWVLHRLANDDKHRMLHVVQVASVSATYWLSDMLSSQIEAAGMMALGARFDDHDELGRLSGVTDCPGFAAKINLSYDIAFDPEGPARGNRVIFQLDRCREAVRSGVIPRFSELFAS